MKKKSILRRGLLFGIVLSFCLTAFTQDSTTLLLDMKYYVTSTQAPYIHVRTKVKLEKKKFRSIPSIPVSVYLDSVSNENLLGKITTDLNGEGKIFLGASHKAAWDASASHTFNGIADATKPFAETTGELTVTKARIIMDTLTEDTIRYVNVKVEEMRDNEWFPVKDVELKVAISRMGGDLNVGDDATYTTDSLGAASAELKRIDMPGDANGMITLVAKVEDNETYGNLTTEKKVKWGKPFVFHSNFNEASLFATRDKTPAWLLFLAALIITIVWGTLIYLVFQIFKIRRLGRQHG
jgi:hypothetical protein